MSKIKKISDELFFELETYSGLDVLESPILESIKEIIKNNKLFKIEKLSMIEFLINHERNKT